MTEETQDTGEAIEAADAAPDAAAAETKSAEALDAAPGGTTEGSASGGPEADTKVLLSDDEDDGAGGDTGVPDAYTFTSPDDIGEIDMTDAVKAQFDEFGVRAKNANLTQDQYQTLVSDEIRRGRGVMEKMAGDYQQRVHGWGETTRNDKEMGGDDLKLTLSNAALGMKQFGTPELNALFKKPSPENPEGLGIGNHPEIIRLLHRVGTQVKESGELADGDVSKLESDASLRRMYPSMFKDEAAA